MSDVDEPGDEVDQGYLPDPVEPMMVGSPPRAKVKEMSWRTGSEAPG